MLITRKIRDVYTSNIKMTNQEIKSQNPMETAKMGMILTKIDIMIAEIDTIRAEPFNQKELYKIIENNEEGNPMSNGAEWRARTMKIIRETFYEIICSSNIPENYKKHEKMLKNVIKENRWTEKMEFVAVGWVETDNQHTWTKSKMTKRSGSNFEARMEIFETKTKVAIKCQENTQLGKYVYKNLLECKLEKKVVTKKN